jgi:hypothetical protein
MPARRLRQDRVGRLRQAVVRGSEQVLKYLARYTHRVAISNHRLTAMEDGAVTFRWKDYSHGNERKMMKLEAAEFIRRFIGKTGESLSQDQWLNLDTSDGVSPEAESALPSIAD